VAVVARAWRVARRLPRRRTFNHPGVFDTVVFEAFAIEAAAIEAFAIEETGNTEETGTGVALTT
jgi:hypothetical protein